MSRRLIDGVPEPAEKGKSPKLFVVSASRTGTLGLYKALRMLGYRPYHMIEATSNGVRDCRLFAEAIRGATAAAAAAATTTTARHEKEDADADATRRPPPPPPRRHHGAGAGPAPRPYGRAELDKWFAGYDVVIEVPSYLGPAVLDAYAADPDVRFLLTERDPDAWVRSYDGSVGALLRRARALPLRLLRHFDPFNREFLRLTGLMWSVFADGRAPDDPAALPVLRERYVEYIDWVKAHAPPDRLRVIKLEDGLGWEQFCDFLGHDVPTEPFPRGNDAEEFANIVDGLMAPGITKAITILSSTTVALVGVAAWFALRKNPLLLRKLW